MIDLNERMNQELAGINAAMGITPIYEGLSDLVTEYELNMQDYFVDLIISGEDLPTWNPTHVLSEEQHQTIYNALKMSRTIIAVTKAEGCEWLDLLGVDLDTQVKKRQSVQRVYQMAKIMRDAKADMSIHEFEEAFDLAGM